MSSNPGSYNDSQEDFFNGAPNSNINDQNGANGNRNEAERHSNRTLSPGHDTGDVPRPKRIACVVCRKRKLRCDGTKPSCGTCARLGHDCAYDEVRRKSGPKRGYVKALEARLAQVETLLKTQDPQDSNTSNLMNQDGPQIVLQPPDFQSGGISPGSHDNVSGMFQSAEYDAAMQSQPLSLEDTLGTGDNLTWEMIGLGLDEPLPPQDVIDELHQIYFEKVHPSIPVIHRARFLAAMNLSPQARPPVCLRYAMWTLAASVSERYSNFQAHFYQRARKYLEETEMKGHGESMITIAHSQTWILIASYEFKLMYFPRAWMSTGRAIRLAQMMGLHRLDGVGLDVKQCIPPPRDWTEREERRRTFWMAFCIDRYASIGTGWPMTIEEKDILTMLPANEEAYNKSKPSRTMSLQDALNPEGAANLSPFAGVVLMACLFGRNLIHLHRPDTDDRDDDLNGEFWKRHRNMDNILSNTSLNLPSHLKLPMGIGDPNIVFTNMNIHTSTICLHQAAIFKADKNRLPANVSADSKIRCITAAAEIANIMRQISHMDLSAMNPFISFCLYVAARVFVQYLRSRPDDEQVKGSLQFLLTAMDALKRKNPLTASFLVQLDVDLEGSGLDSPLNNSRFAYGLKKGVSEIPVCTDSVSCSPLLDIRESQTAAQPIFPSPHDNNEMRDSKFATTYLPDMETVINLPSRDKPPSRGGVEPVPVSVHGMLPTLGAKRNNSMTSSPGTMDMSPESDRHSVHTGSLSGASDRPTPGTNSIGNGSSTQSYTPPQLDDSMDHTPAPGTSGGGGYYFAQAEFMPHLPPGQYLPPTPGKDADASFGLPEYLDGDGAGNGELAMLSDLLEINWELAGTMNPGGGQRGTQGH